MKIDSTDSLTGCNNGFVLVRRADLWAPQYLIVPTGTTNGSNTYRQLSESLLMGHATRRRPVARQFSYAYVTLNKE
jgi:hypothetical protein